MTIRKNEGFSVTYHSWGFKKSICNDIDFSVRSSYYDHISGLGL